MICSSCLVDDLTTLVLDTSVLINLHASTFGEAILASIPNAIVVPDVVIRELGNESSRSSGEYEFIKDLVSCGIVECIKLDEEGYSIFKKLISGTNSIDDGEAATIAVAARRDFLPVIDDGKGRTLAKSMIGHMYPAWSLDLFLHPNVQVQLAPGKFVDAIHLALRKGRMRIDATRCEAVVKLIGVERAKHCTSLPGYKMLLKHWEQERD